jgi:hypothetical protein
VTDTSAGDDMADHSKDADAGGGRAHQHDRVGADERHRPVREGPVRDAGAPLPGSRDRHRDGDDVRDPIPDDQRLGTRPDTKTEARGGARENVGDTARGTAAERTGPDAADPRDRGDDRPRYAQGSE